MPLEAGRDADDALRVAKETVVRSAFGSHSRFPLATVHDFHPPRSGTVAAALFDQSKRDGLSKCVPLYWVPVWAFSFADSFVSSLVPLDELQSAGIIDEHVQLRPDLWSWPRYKNPIYRMIATLSAENVRTLREAAPRCSDGDFAQLLRHGRRSRKRHCAPTCHERTLVCNFQSTFDDYAPPMAPWRAAQRVAESVVQMHPVAAATALAASAAMAEAAVRRGVAVSSSVDGVRADAAPPELRVVFVNRTRTKFPRSLSNLGVLLQRCANPQLRWAAGTRVRCSAHEFGAGKLAADVEAARAADVLVGTHGAGLTNAFYMRRGAAMVEVRPYRFEGPWPDRYFRALSSLEQAVHYFQVSSGSAELSLPRPKDDVSVWDARDHAVRLPWRTLREVLHAVLEVNSSHARYVRRMWAKGVVFVSTTTD